MTMMIGYLRCALIRRDDLLLVEHQLRQCALVAEGVLTQVRQEPAPKANALYSLMQHLDHRHESRLIPMLTTLANREQIDLRPFRGAPASSTVLWTAVADIESAGRGGYLVVPSMNHLEGLDVPRQQVMERLAKLQPYIGVLDASAAEQVPPVADAGEKLIGEFQVAPVPLAEEIIRINSRTRLARFAFGDMIDRVDILMRELVGTVTETDHLSGQDHTLTIFIHHDASKAVLVITCLDSRDFADKPPHPAVHAACHGGSVTRSRYGSGTATRCEIPLISENSETSTPTTAFARR
ncbi:hypothetical protein [Nocardia sp. XZ_19_231]|uniref:hypothetical protein n=1 Tax=Nocardia sp. XZ_19_231 TaxID=2769252 RepID=UPI00188DD69F|nr:hypothetical protein [Nocardia sp. XZ_19_231]